VRTSREAKTVKHHCRRRLLTLVVSVLALHSVAMPVPAAGVIVAPRATTLTIRPLEPIPVGRRPTIDVSLVDDRGWPQGNKVVLLHLDGEQVRRARTEADGTAAIRISRDLDVGSYEVTAEFIGTRDYLPARAATSIMVRPVVLTVETVPPAPGVRFALAGREFVTGEDGLARIEHTERGVVPLEILLEPGTPLTADTRATFARWSDEVFQPARTIRISDDNRIAAGLSLSHQVTQRFFDLDGDSVSPARITSITFRVSNGATHTFGDGEARWLQASRVQRRRTGLEPTPLQYSVESVMVDGTNVVNRYQQRFYPQADDVWDIELLLYSARFQARDAFFGFPAGSGILLEYPDGRIESFPFGDAREAYVDSLARGLYGVKVAGVRGVAPFTPVALSRDQEVELKVLTALDIALALASGALLALGLLFYGRPYLVGRGGSNADRGGRRRTLVEEPVERPANPPPRGRESERRARRERASMLALAIFGAVAVMLGDTRGTEEPPLLGSVPENRPPTERQMPWREPNVVDPVPVMAYYYIWFDPGSWNRAKIDFPLLGRYSSDDRSVMEQHVRWAIEAGIDGFIVSWKSTYPLDRRLEQLIDVAEAHGFYLWIIYQGLDFDRDPLPLARISNDVQFFLDRYANRPAFSMYDLPVLIWSGTWEFSTSEIRSISDDYGDRLYLLATERNVADYLRLAALVDGNAYYWSSVNPDTFPRYEEKLATMGEAVHRFGGLWVAPAAPGFDARLVGGATVVERRDGETLRRQLDAALRSSPDAIGLISWNEFSENSHVEPSRNHGTSSLEVLADRRVAVPPHVIDFDSSAPGTTARDDRYSLYVLAGAVAFIAASVSLAVARAAREQRAAMTLLQSPPIDDGLEIDVGSGAGRKAPRRGHRGG
jgi:hypothetical protein